MRRPWSEHGDETHQRTAEDDERAMQRARAAYARRAPDISRGQPGDGRCTEHRIRGCRCEVKHG